VILRKGYSYRNGSISNGTECHKMASARLKTTVLPGDADGERENDQGSDARPAREQPQREPGVLEHWGLGTRD
jgi:hypothetical protein